MRKYRYTGPTPQLLIDTSEDTKLDTDFEETPITILGKTTDIPTTYQLALQLRSSADPKPSTSVTIDARAGRLVLRLIHARLLERAKIHYEFLKKGTGTEDSLIVIDAALDAGLSFHDIDPLFSERDYHRYRQDVVTQTARRNWIATRSNPTLSKIAPIDADIQKGRVTLSDIVTTSERFDQAKLEAHTAFARDVINVMRYGGGPSRELMILLRTACQAFHVDIRALELSADEYRTLLELYQLAS